MLTNKKFIRLAALVMALLMTVAVFAGCSNKKVDAMQEQVNAADQAAKDAQAAANEAAKKAQEQAEQLQKLLEELKKAQEEGFAGTQEGIKDLEDKVEGYHPEGGTPSIDEGTFNEITNEVVKQEKLKAYTELTTLYTVDRADWYTAANYSKLVKIFEEAAYELYRATTIDGIDQIIAEASAAAAAVDSIVSDAAKVQALIDAFGDVETEIFTTNEDKVFAARDAFDAWVNTYATRFFTKNGYSFEYNKGAIVTADKMIAASASISGKEVPVAKDIVDFAKKLTGGLVAININDNTNSLLFAEKKVAALHEWALAAIKNEMKIELMIAGVEDAEDIVDDLFKSVADKEITQVAWNEVRDLYKDVLKYINRYGVNYAEVKAYADLIEAAYTEYRVFWNANGGDDSAIAGVPGEQLLTGTEFVKRYVQTLYDGQLKDYQNTVNTYLSEYVVNFFMNNEGNISTIPAALADSLAYYFDYDMGYANDGSAIVASVSEAISFKVVDGGIQVEDAAGTYTFKADGIAIEHAFNTVAAKAYASIFDLVYSEDFKGNKSLDEAFVAIDQIVIKAIIDMTQVYYDEVITPVMVELFTLWDEGEHYYYVEQSWDDEYYDAKDKDFYNKVLSKMLDDAIATVKAVKVPTYDELNAIEDKENKIKNIEDQKLFNVNKDAKGVFSGVTVATGANTAFETILAHFEDAMEESAKALYTKTELIEDTISFHDLKTEYAFAVEAIFGMGATFDDAKDKAGATNVVTAGSTGLLGADFYEAAQAIMGKNDDDTYKLKESAIYKKVNTQATALRNAIMALEFVDANTLEAKYTFEKYQAKDTSNNHKDLYYNTTDKKAVTDKKSGSINNAALEIIVDREVVAVNAIINTFAEGANKALKAFADQVRSEIKAGIAGGVELYKNNYSFGNLDLTGVYLEKDMNEYLAYLDTLTNLEAVTDFSAVTFTKATEYIAKDSAVNTLYGDAQVVTDAKGTVTAYLPHIDLEDVTIEAEEVTGVDETEGAWYNKLAKADITAYLGMANQTNVYAGLEDVRTLAYAKDTIVKTALPELKLELLGKWDAAANDWAWKTVSGIPTVQYTPALTYYMNDARTELFLAQFDAAYDRIVAAIEAVTLLHEDVELDLEAALEMIFAIGAQAEFNPALDNDNDGQIDGFAYDETDDMSLYIAYYRYYSIGQYNWALYNQNIAD